MMERQLLAFILGAIFGTALTATLVGVIIKKVFEFVHHHVVEEEQTATTKERSK